MINIKHIFALAIIALSLVSCDETTDTLGNSLTNTADQFETLTDTFEVKSRSIAVDSVLSSGQYSYLGHIKDPETNSYITSHYTTQFVILPTFQDYTLFPSKDSIRSFNDNGDVIADSCKMVLYLYNSVGDSLNPMRLTVYEMSKPVEEGIPYYTDFNPETNGYIRRDGLRKNKNYTVVDLNISDSLRGLIVDKTNMQMISISLNDEYTDVDGNKYNNYGTYLMSKYYNQPETYHSSYSFAHNVCPGFYIKSTDGVGVMSQVYLTELNIYFRYKNDTIISTGSTNLSGTEEVLQTVNIHHDKASVKSLVEDETCTYLKSPAGIFTEVELPILEIMEGHTNDTVSSAKIIFNRILSDKGEDDFIAAPSNVLMIPKDSLYSFFENKNLPDNEHTYLASNSTSYNSYTFNNIASLVASMYRAYTGGNASQDWNKVLLVPVDVVTSESSSSSTTVTSISNNMQLTSTQLVGGENNQRNPITISVIYNRFNK